VQRLLVFGLDEVSTLSSGRGVILMELDQKEKLLAVASVGSVTAAANSDVFVTGVSALGQVGSVTLWGTVDDNQTPNWQNVNDAQTENWIVVNDGNTVVWTQVLT
jgi:hypothetical protein